MMKIAKLLFIVICCVIFLFSCKNENVKNLSDEQPKEGYEVLTQLIKYSVPIKNFNDTVGFFENISNPKKQQLTDLLLNAVIEKKVKAYDSDGNPLNIETLKKNLSLEKEFVRENEDGTQMNAKVKLDMSKMVDKIAFLEEWHINPKTLHISKKVVGICPMIPVFLSDATVAGYLELFWIYFDDKYPSKLNSYQIK